MPRGGQNAIPEADLIAALQQLADDLGRSPSQKDINEHSPHSAKTYYRKFDGGMQEAKRVAGLETYEQQGRKRVTVNCGFCGVELQRRPSDIQDKAYSYCNKSCEHQHRSTRYLGENNPAWNSIELECAYCGSKFYRPVWDADRYDNHFCPGSDCYGQWRSELMEGGYAPIHDREFPTGPDHFRYKADKITYMGPNWPKQQLKAIIRDQARCQEPGCNENGMTQTTKHGSDVPVHHIIPREAFWGGETFDYKTANQVDNLVCLCRAHHRRRHR